MRWILRRALPDSQEGPTLAATFAPLSLCKVVSNEPRPRQSQWTWPGAEKGSTTWPNTPSSQRQTGTRNKLSKGVLACGACRWIQPIHRARSGSSSAQNHLHHTKPDSRSGNMQPFDHTEALDVFSFCFFSKVPKARPCLQEVTFILKHWQGSCTYDPRSALKNQAMTDFWTCVVTFIYALR